MLKITSFDRTKSVRGKPIFWYFRRFDQNSSSKKPQQINKKTWQLVLKGTDNESEGICFHAE